MDLFLCSLCMYFLRIMDAKDFISLSASSLLLSPNRNHQPHTSKIILTNK